MCIAAEEITYSGSSDFMYPHLSFIWTQSLLSTNLNMFKAIYENYLLKINIRSHMVLDDVLGLE